MTEYFWQHSVSLSHVLLRGYRIMPLAFTFELTPVSNVYENLYNHLLFHHADDEEPFLMQITTKL